jgi:hypothetical protein
VTVPSERRVVGSLRRVSLAAAWLCALLGALVLLGWALDLSILKSLHPHLSSMKPSSAAAFVLAGFALVLVRRPDARSRRLGRGCAALVAAIPGQRRPCGARARRGRGRHSTFTLQPVARSCRVDVADGVRAPRAAGSGPAGLPARDEADARG